MPETSRCATISIATPQITVTINSIRIMRDRVVTNAIYKGEDLARYDFMADITVSGGTPNLLTAVIYLGRDQNNLVEIGRGSIPGYSGTFGIGVAGEGLKIVHGYRTTDDILNKAGVSTLTSCACCVKIIWQ
jgi:hypothetical protein